MHRQNITNFVIILLSLPSSYAGINLGFMNDESDMVSWTYDLYVNEGNWFTSVLLSNCISDVLCFLAITI